jgi:hypothetical protein
MKRHGGFLFLLALLLPVSNALTQIADSPTSNDLPHSVNVARCAYTQAEPVCANVHSASQDVAGNDDRDPGGDTTLAQIPRRMPGQPLRGRRLPMGGPAYPTMWQPQPSPGHALIGAVIGFGLGAAIAAKGNAGGRAIFALGTVGAGLGAAIGITVPSFPPRNSYRQRWPDDDEMAAHSNPHKTKVASSIPGSPHVTSLPPFQTPAEEPLPAAEAP